MKKYFVFAALVLAAAVSCTRELATEEVAAPKKGYVQITLSATCDSDTKAALDGSKVVWAVGEEVAVFPGSATTAEKFTVKEVDGSNVTITGSVPEGTSSFIAAYPYGKVISAASGVVTMSIGAQTISGSEVIAPDALESVAYFESAEATPVFKNVVALASFTVADEGITEVTLAPTEGAFGSNVAVTVSNADPVIKLADGSETNSVTVTKADGFTPGTTYYAAVAPGAFTGLKADIAKGDKFASKTSEKAGTFSRSKVLSLGSLAIEGAWKLGVITNAAELAEFLAAADTYAAGEKAELGNDIDCSGATITPATTFEGIFEGNGYTIKNLSIANALFAKLKASGVVQNVKVDAASSINWTEAVPDQTGVAFIVSSSNGTVKNCEVAGKIKVKSDDAGRIYCAGVVGESPKGLVEGCKFTGSIDVEFTTNSASCSAIAGVVARVGHTDTAGKVIVKDCENTGSIKFVFSGATKQMKKFGIGGVVGQTVSVDGATNDYGIIEGCINRGNIEWQYSAGGSGSYPALGGVVGIVEGQLKSCANYGTVKYTGSKTVAATDASIGGVAGYVTLGASDCHNYGELVLDAAFAGGTALAQSGGNTSCSAFGGVFGAAGQYASGEILKDDDSFTPPTATEVVIENCTNEAVLSLTPMMIQSGGPKFLIGGVIGASTAKLKNCKNLKDVSIKSQPRWILAGGVAGIQTADATSCSNEGTLSVDADKDNHPGSVAKQQHYIGGVFGYIWKGTTIDGCSNSKAVSLVNIFTTPTALSYLGGIIGSYKGANTLQNCVNSGAVSYDAENPICLGGVAGGFNGTMTTCSNSGIVNNKSTYTAAGKESEVGGLVGYANASFSNCTNTGAVSSASPDGATGGFVGGFGEADKIWTGLSDAPVSGPNAGSIFGWFRKDTEHTITLGQADAPFTVSEKATVNGEAPTVDSIVGNIKNGKTDNVNLVIAGKAIIPFVEDLANNKFTYAGREYPIVKLKDGRWWMAKNLAYLPSGMTPATDLTAVTAGVFAPIRVKADQTGAEFSTDESVVAANGYLYQSEVALGLKVGDITTVAQAKALEKAQGICPPGWHVPGQDEILALVGASAGATTNTSAPYYDGSKGSLSMLNADGFGMDAYGFVSIQDNTKTSGIIVGWVKGYPDKLSSGMFCGSTQFNVVTYNTSGDETSGLKNIQFAGFMPMTNKATEEDYSCSGTNVSYRIAAPLRCIRNAE